MRHAVGLAAVTAILALAAAAQAGETKVVWLDDLDVGLSSCGYSSTARRMSVDRHPLKLRGRTYDRGIGTHAPGLFRIDLGGRAIRFQATAGIDDETGNAGTAEFRVIGDDKVLWSSGVLRGGQEIKPCSVDLKGVKTLDLYVDTTPDGYSNDHTDWVDAKIEYAGSPAPAAQKLPRNLTFYTHHWPSADQVFAPASLPAPTDRDEADAVLRRVGVLLDYLRTLPGCPDLSAQAVRLAELKAQARATELLDGDARAKLLDQACLLRRKVAFSNPLLNFDKILFIKRHFCPDSEMTGNHMCDQYFGFNAIRGGGLFVLENAFGEHPTVRNVLEKSVCGNGRFAGQRLTSDGGFLSPSLRFDGRQILFAWTQIADKEPDRLRYSRWTENNTYKIFRVNPDGGGLTQLTDGPWDDFDPCYLPNGRVVFISERRGGFGRCHGRPVPSYTLHSMTADGGDIVCLSPHETNEWQPSVGNDGMIVYTRWDYVDRGFSQAHHPWTTTPDGRDPRPIHGNYNVDQGGRPHLEVTVRAVPGSRKYMATAACHHGQAYGSIILIDPAVKDDDRMSPVKRLTPDQSFPESEVASHRDPACYAAAWPLSEYFFLCVYDADSRSNAGTENNYGIYLVDAFGNRELLYRDPAISCLDPIPLQARPTPPVIPDQVAAQAPAKGPAFVPPDPLPSPGAGTVGVMNVYNSLLPLPKDTRITQLRIVQLLPKTTPYANGPRIGYGDQKGARMVLGTVPVEADGSAYFKMPAGRPVYFQALGADGLAVQSMRSATYIHPGERLTCRGCHEPPGAAYGADHIPQALRRAPSEIAPDVAGSRPFSYPILVQPVLDRNCVACHTKSRSEGKQAPDLTRGDHSKDPGRWFNSYESLRSFAFYWDNAGFDPVVRSTPGHIGAQASRLCQMLAKGHHDAFGQKLSGDDLHRIELWLDCNSDFLGSFDNVQEQVEGKVVWPKLE